MARLKRKILLLILIAVFCVGVVLFPLILILAGDLVGMVVNRPFSHCEVMDRSRLEAALREGLDINAGCCAEHMIGECSIARPNSSPLIFAIENRALDSVKLLLDRGADVNKFTQSGYALSTAASLGEIAIVEALLGHAISPESRETALRMAGHFGHADIAKLILDREAPESKGSSCAKLACSLATELEQIGAPQLAQQRDLLLHLISTCLDANISCEGGSLLGRLAKKDEYAPLIKALLERGADPNAKEANGKSVRDNIKAFYDYDTRPQVKALID